MGLGNFFGLFCFILFVGILPLRAESSADQVLKAWQKADSHRGVQSLTELLLKKPLNVAQSRELIGGLKRILPADEFSNFMTDLLHAYAQQSFEQLETPREGMWFWSKDSKDLARALKIYWRNNFNRDSESVFLAIMHFSRNKFSEPHEVLEFYYKDSLSFFPPDLKEGKTDLINLILFHLGDQLARWNQWFDKDKEMDTEEWSRLLMILEFPRLLLKNFKETDGIPVRFPWPNDSFSFYHSKFINHYERALKQIFASASDSQKLILTAKLGLPQSLDLQHFYENLLIDYADKLARLGRGFRDFAAYIENLLPEDESLREKIKDIGRNLRKKNLPMLASVEIFLKEIEGLSSAERIKLKTIEQISREIIHHDYCQKKLSSLGGFGR